jgi:hypothetical protein
MKYVFLAILGSLMITTRTLPAQQQPSSSTRFSNQIHAAAMLEHQLPGRADSSSVRVATHRTISPIVGAAIGAVALPAIGYLIFHGRDSGSVQIGTLLPIAAIGAFLGLMVGLHTSG